MKGLLEKINKILNTNVEDFGSLPQVIIGKNFGIHEHVDNLGNHDLVNAAMLKQFAYHTGEGVMVFSHGENDLIFNFYSKEKHFDINELNQISKNSFAHATAVQVGYKNHKGDYKPAIHSPRDHTYK